MIVDIAGYALKSEDLTPTQTVPAEWVLSGTVEEASQLVHASPDGKFVVKVWECRTAAEVELQGYPVDEFVTLISGSVTVAEKGGEARTYTAGESFLIRKGHVGRWVQTGPVRKYSVCYLG